MGIGKGVVSEGEPESASDQYVVAMKREETFIGHLLGAVAHVLLFVVENILCS